MTDEHDLKASNMDKRKEDTEFKVKEFVQQLEEERGRFQQIVLGIKILFLSCEEDIRKNAKNEMGEEYTPFIIEDIKEMPSFKDLPEFEIEKRALNYVDIIIVVESEEIEKNHKCPGLTQECTYIMLHKDLQDKTIYIVPDTLTYEKITNLTGLHYIYFPNIYRCSYNDKNALIKLAVLLAKKEAHRLSFAVLNEEKSQYSKIKTNINESKNNR